MYRTVIEKLVLPAGDIISGTKISRQLRYWRKVAKFPEDDITRLSRSNLNQILDFATKSIPFYSDISLNHIREPEERLLSFPVMQKEDIRNNLDDLLFTRKSDLI